MIPDNSIIDLSHVDMASSNFFKLCQCIKNSKLSSNKTEYNLSLCNIEEKKFPLLYEALSTLTNEFSLILNFNKLNSLQAVQDMKRIFNDLVKLKSLSLDGTRLGNIGLIELSSTIFMTKTLTSLSLDSNHLSFDGIVVFSKILPQIPSLKILILRGNDLSEEKSLQVLSTNVILSNIQTLSLDMCQISPTSVRPLGSLLTQSRTLTSLNLSSNHLNSMGMRLLVDGLGENFYLHTLCLAGCFIGLQGLTYLTATLVDNDTLRSLDLSRIHAHEEPFGEEGGKLIADMLTLNRGITNLK